MDNQLITSIIYLIFGSIITFLIIFFVTKINEKKNKKLEELTDNELEQEKKIENFKYIEMQKEIAGMTKILEAMKQEISNKSYQESQQRGIFEQKLNNIVEKFNKNTEVTEGLSNALKSNVKFQGDFGETNLKKLLEVHGFKENVHYTYQDSFRDENNKIKRPDFNFKLPDGNQVFIDSKVSLKHWVEYQQAKNDIEKETLLKENLNSIKNQIKLLSDAEYVKLANSKTDFIIMYLPVEGAYNAALSLDKDIFLKAQKLKILVCTPTTMMFCLNLIKNVFQRHQVNKNSLEISRQTGDLYDKFIDLLNNLMDLSRDINKVRSGFDNTFKKIKTGKGSIVSRIEKIRSLGIQTKKPIPNEFEVDLDENESKVKYLNDKEIEKK